MGPNFTPQIGLRSFQKLKRKTRKKALPCPVDLKGPNLLLQNMERCWRKQRQPAQRAPHSRRTCKEIAAGLCRNQEAVHVLQKKPDGQSLQECLNNQLSPVRGHPLAFILLSDMLPELIFHNKSDSTSQSLLWRRHAQSDDCLNRGATVHLHKQIFLHLPSFRKNSPAQARSESVKRKIRIASINVSAEIPGHTEVFTLPHSFLRS